VKKRVVTTVRKTGPVEKIHGVVVRIPFFLYPKGPESELWIRDKIS
jgi:hypothetical protein